MEHFLINAIHSHLTHAARSEEDLVPYSDVIQMAGIGSLGGGAVRGALGEVLFDVIQYDWTQDADRPMLSAVAVSASTHRPSEGFYTLAREIGRLTSSEEWAKLEFWAHELGRLRDYWRTHSETTLRRKRVTYEMVYPAIHEFDVAYPDSANFDRWMEKDAYKFALEFDGKLYPPKPILSVAAGLSIQDFSGGEETTRVFRQLGLVIIDKPGIARIPAARDYTTYLLTWNPGKFSWEDFAEDWEAVYTGSRPRFRWSCGNTRSIKVGDRVFLMRLGYREAITGIVASGVVTEPPFEAGNWNSEGSSPSALYIEFEPDILLNPGADALLNPRKVSVEFEWHPQRSGVTVPNAIAVQLEEAWQRHVQRTGPIEVMPEARRLEPPAYVEGSRILVSSYRYERDPRAREACVAHHGTQCVICGFDFGETFGALGAGFIHVHHLTPMSERDAEYTIDPVEDLCPVCPNCHAMLHRKSPPYSITELQEIRERAADQRRP